MQQNQTQVTVRTNGPGLLDITSQVRRWVEAQSIDTGLLTLFIRHTSASLTIQENADPDVLTDLMDFFSRIVPEGAHYLHSTEGPDDMPAHIKSALTATQLSVPVANGALALGTWQGIYVFEHRAHPHQRSVMLHLMGE